MLSDIFHEFESRLQPTVGKKEATLEAVDAVQVGRGAASAITQLYLRKHVQQRVNMQRGLGMMQWR